MITQLTIEERRLRQQLDELTERLSKNVPPFADNTTEGIRRRHHQHRRNTRLFGELYLPHYFTAPSALFHEDLDAMVDHGERHIFALHGPREHAKSSRIRAKLLHKLLLGEIQYWLFGSQDMLLSRKHVEAFKVEMEHNVRLQADFALDILKWDEGEGILRVRVTPRATGHSHTFQLEATSYGTTVKGRLWLHLRPEGIFIDDFENTRRARNERISREKLDWVIQEVYPAVTGPVIWVGNTGHDTSALFFAMLRCYDGDEEALRAFLKHGTVPGAEIPAYPPALASNGLGRLKMGVGEEAAQEEAGGEAVRAEMTCYSYRAERTDEETGEVVYLWPERFAPTWYASMRATMGHLYQGEMNGYPVVVGLFFKAEWFPLYDQLPEGDDVELRFFSWCDPAFGKSKHACYKVVVVVATDGHQYYVVDAWARQQDTVRAMIDAWYSFFGRYPELRHGAYENNFGQDDRLARDLLDAEEEHGFPLPVAGESNRGAKEARIESMQPLSSTNRISFPRHMSPDVKTLYSQLLAYPDDEYSDGPDALESAIARTRYSAHLRPSYQSMGRRRYAGRRRMRA